MKLVGLSEPQLAEAAHVVSVLLQTYSNPLNVVGTSQTYCDHIARSLTFVLDDISQTREGAARPIPELIRLFNKTNNRKTLRYTVASAPAPFEFDVAEWTHYDGLAEATEAFGKSLEGQTAGWVAVWDNQELRVIGELYL